MWIVIGGVSLYELFRLVFLEEDSNMTKILIFSMTLVLSVVMFFVRRKQRLRYESRKNQSQ